MVLSKECQPCRFAVKVAARAYHEPGMINVCEILWPPFHGKQACGSGVAVCLQCGAYEMLAKCSLHLKAVEKDLKAQLDMAMQECVCWCTASSEGWLCTGLSMPWAFLAPVPKSTLRSTLPLCPSQADKIQ